MSPPPPLNLSKAEIDVLRARYDRLTESEFEAFLAAAKRYGLNPLANQIYAQVRAWTDRNGRGHRSVGYETQLAGLRLIAARTDELAGSDDAVFTEEAAIGKLRADVKATVVVYRLVAGTRQPFTASARWGEYVAEGAEGRMWAKMPRLMLAKCAEALALRKAFPAELSGIYASEEMDQSGRQDERPSFDPDQAAGGGAKDAGRGPQVGPAPGVAHPPIGRPEPTASTPPPATESAAAQKPPPPASAPAAAPKPPVDEWTILMPYHPSHKGMKPHPQAVVVKSSDNGREVYSWAMKKAYLAATPEWRKDWNERFAFPEALEPEEAQPETPF